MKQEVVKRMRKYAARHHTSVSKIAENMFTVITRDMGTDTMEISSRVKSFSIDGINIPEGFDYKQALAEALDEKYL